LNNHVLNIYINDDDRTRRNLVKNCYTKSMKRYFSFLLLIGTVNFCNAQSTRPSEDCIAKPWTRWWWMGSAVDEAGIKKQLKQLAEAGFGGVEIVPIYGVKGYESKYIKYLSPQWMKMLKYTVGQAKELNMGVYISVGTGWPIGGSNVTIDDAASKLIIQKYSLKANEKLMQKIIPNDAKQNGNAVLGALMLFKKNGESADVSNRLLADGSLDFICSEDAELIAAFTGKTNQVVKRAAPGGEGYTIDHFSKDATDRYFKIFDDAFGNSSHGVKAFFNDSYEVYNANWTPQFFAEFEKRRGYDLKKYLDIFTSSLTNDTIARLKSDYRETISDLMMENFSSVFAKWTNERKALSVNQAHGSPGNLLDLYGAFDIPECETYGSSAFDVRGLRRDSADIRNVDPDPIMLKFASSAAHAYQKKLTSCETFTWLGEHFKTSWSQCKPELDQVFLSGVNHVFYHGTTYTPANAAFPGWVFYASVNFVPNNSMWDHLKGMNNYISRCQQILQAGTPDKGAIKMYWPVYDIWSDAKGMDMPLQVHSIDKWLHPSAFYKNVRQLQASGYEVDFLSDKMISEKCSESPLKTQKNIYVISECKLMPLATLKNIFELVARGNTVIMQAFPQDVAGFGNLKNERTVFQQLENSISFKSVGDDMFAAENGKLILSKKIEKALGYVNLIKRETISDLGLRFIKRQLGDNTYYFISNNTARDIDEKIELAAAAESIEFTNPLNGDKGYALKENNKLRIQLKSGQSLIVAAKKVLEKGIPQWKYTDTAGEVIHLENNNWQLNFTTGGPLLPTYKTMSKIQPWTNFTNDSTTQSFSGTAVYTTTFTLKSRAADYLLQLDKLYESARVFVNGKEAGLIWSLPFELKVGKYLKEGKNTISIEVCNLMANRIRNMDRNGEVWRNYHEINFVNINYKDFDAGNWRVQPSGIEGTVKLVGLK
jgi:hypothetical protein